MASSNDDYDYIVVGGGLAGCTLASLLRSSKDSSPSVLLIEAGPDVSEHPLTQTPLACFGAHFSSLDWNYTTVPQTHLDHRPTYQAAGKALGGGSATNYGTWTRGSKFDYDRWGKLVGDDRWSYDGLLPYFEKVESRHGANTTAGNEGHITAISVSQSSKNRKYPLRDTVLEGWRGFGLDHISDANSGHPLGVAEMVENWRDGHRQPSNKAFDLTGVTVMTDTVVRRILLEDKNGKIAAVGVELPDQKRFLARKEVILSAGAYRTPQLLLLSGLGPRKELEKIGIPVQVDIPGVGKNFHDHLVVALSFRLKDPSSGFALGGANGPWADPAYQLGLPADWIVTEHVPSSYLEDAVKRDLGSAQPGEAEDPDFVLDPQACHLESLIIYVPGGQPIVNMHVPFDGSHIGAVVGVMSPTSRGTVSVSSASALDAPVIDPNYNATEVDRVLMRYGVRRVLHLVHNSMSDTVDSENAPPSLESLSNSSSDAAIDARVRAQGRTFFHAGGTASMGTVVDTELRVKGVEGLRVVDASVLPVSIAGHYQVVTYAVAARAAELIANKA